MKSQNLITSRIELEANQILDLNKQLVILANGSWVEKDMRKASSFILQWKAIILNAESNEHSTILKDIKHISFPSLREIDVTDNNIESLEGMNRMWIPCLKKITLNNNKLTSINEFNKGNWPFLENISFPDNYISTGEKIFKMKLPSLKVLIIEFMILDNKQCHDANFLMKIETKKLDLLFLNNKDRIQEKEFEKKAFKKYMIKLNSLW